MSDYTHATELTTFCVRVTIMFLQCRAFVAAVKQEFLSRSHVLVTMGGGGFSINVWGRFTARQSKKRLHVLCPVAE